MFFALAEAKTLLAMLYDRFTFKLVDGFKLTPSRCVIDCDCGCDCVLMRLCAGATV